MSAASQAQEAVALIAGAGQPLGRTLALALAQLGAAVVLASTTRATQEVFAVNSAANELWALERRHLVLTMDYQEPASIAAALQQALSRFGRFDLLITLTALPSEPRAFLDLPASDWQRAMNAELTGVALTCHAAGQAMLDRGQGSILTVVSAAARGRGGAAAAAAGQAGVLALSRSLAEEWRGNLSVNAAIASEGANADALVALLPLLLQPRAAFSGQTLEL